MSEEKKRLLYTAVIASLHLHSARSGGSMRSVPYMDLVQDKGIQGNGRHFGRLTRHGQPSPRQVSLIERSLLKWLSERQKKDLLEYTGECIGADVHLLPPGKV